LRVRRSNLSARTERSGPFREIAVKDPRSVVRSDRRRSAFRRSARAPIRICTAVIDVPSFP